ARAQRSAPARQRAAPGRSPRPRAGRRPAPRSSAPPAAGRRAEGRPWGWRRRVVRRDPRPAREPRRAWRRKVADCLMAQPVGLPGGARGGGESRRSATTSWLAAGWVAAGLAAALTAPAAAQPAPAPRARAAAPAGGLPEVVGGELRVGLNQSVRLAIRNN